MKHIRQLVEGNVHIIIPLQNADHNCAGINAIMQQHWVSRAFLYLGLTSNQGFKGNWQANWTTLAIHSL